MSSPQDPTVCQRLPPPPPKKEAGELVYSVPHIQKSNQTTPARRLRLVLRRKSGSSSAGHLMATSHTQNPRRSEVKLLRKEVIQPHLPVRLPCYDFVPIASPTFDRSPPCGLGHGLRVLPTFVT